MILKAGTYKFNPTLTMYDFSNAVKDGNFLKVTNEINFTSYYIVPEYEIEQTLNYYKIVFEQYVGTPEFFSMIYYQLDENGDKLNGGTNVYDSDPESSSNSNFADLPEGVVMLNVITLPEDTEVDDTFGTWYKANTDYDTVNSGSSESNGAEITYNGKVITTLKVGETATLKCSGKRMKSDLIVKIL